MSCGRMPQVNADMAMMENYDPNKPVCDNQDDFNMAFRKAVKYTNKKNMKEAQPWLIVYAVLWLIFLFWGVMLAMKIPSGPERVEHIVFAIVFGPAYVLAYYLSAMGKGGTMGFRRRR